MTRSLKNFMKAKRPFWNCNECECITLKCWRENDTFCNCGTSSEGPGVEYTFKDWDGTILKKWSIDEWATPKAPADPAREWYTFTWWEPEVGPLSKDTTYVAQYEINQYTVTIASNDATMWIVDESSLIVEYWTAISENSNVLTIDTVDVTATAETWYSFSSWTDGDWNALPATITWDITIIANFTV